MQNGPMINMRVMQHLGNRPQGPHNVQPMGSRMQSAGMLQLGSVEQGMPGNTPYVYQNPNGGRQTLPVGKFLW